MRNMLIIDKATNRPVKISVLLAMTVLLTGCATVNRSTQYRLQNTTLNAKEGIAVAAFRAGHDLDGDPSDGGPALLGVLTLGLSSFIYPGHSNFAAFCPKFPSKFNSKIRYHFDDELVAHFKMPLGDQIIWSNEIGSGKTSITQMASIAKKHGKRYLYVIMYNEYNMVGRTSGVSGGYNTTTISYDSLKGSIPMASRMLIDLADNRKVLVNERLGEQDMYAFIIWGVWRFKMGESDAQFDYAAKVAAPDESQAKMRLANYLLKEDIGLE